MLVILVIHQVHDVVGKFEFYTTYIVVLRTELVAKVELFHMLIVFIPLIKELFSAQRVPSVLT